MHDPDQYDPEKREKSRAVAAAPRPASNGASSSSSCGIRQGCGAVRVTRGKDGVIYDPDQYDPNP